MPMYRNNWNALIRLLKDIFVLAVQMLSFAKVNLLVGFASLFSY